MVNKALIELSLRTGLTEKSTLQGFLQSLMKIGSTGLDIYLLNAKFIFFKSCIYLNVRVNQLYLVLGKVEIIKQDPKLTSIIPVSTRGILVLYVFMDFSTVLVLHFCCPNTHEIKQKRRNNILFIFILLMHQVICYSIQFTGTYQLNMVHFIQDYHHIQNHQQMGHIISIQLQRNKQLSIFSTMVYAIYIYKHHLLYNIFQIRITIVISFVFDGLSQKRLSMENNNGFNRRKCQLINGNCRKHLSFKSIYRVNNIINSLIKLINNYSINTYIMRHLTLSLRRQFSQSINLNYQDLKNGKNLQDAIEKAYGPKGHGILFVDGIPDYVQIRKATLPLFSKLANLPQKTLKKYMRPEIYHSQGWSCGVEQFQGKYDTSKGSYYMNCCTDQPQVIEQRDKKHYTPQELKMNVANLWVSQIPEIEKNVKALSKLMIQVGSLLAKQIDSYTHKIIKTYPKDHLYRIISTGTGHIGRILHYFPFEQKGQAQDDWCGWHNDHGSLTALTSAMYVDKEGKQVQLKANSGGLYAQNRFTQMARIAIPSKMLAFQLGQSTQIHTGGYLQATPHCVVRNAQIAGKNVGRNTFALFMEPNHLEIMKTPDGISPEKVQLTKAYKIPQLKDRWDNGIFFKDFHQRTIKHYS